MDKSMLQLQRQLMKKGLSEEEKGELLARERELQRKGDGMRVVFKKEQARSRASSPVTRERPRAAAAGVGDAAAAADAAAAREAAESTTGAHHRDDPAPLRSSIRCVCIRMGPYDG